MRIVEAAKEVITKTQLEKALNIKIEKITDSNTDNFVRLYTKERIYYLRCEDFKDLFGLDNNIFDEDFEVKDNNIIFSKFREIYKGRVNKWKK